MNRNNSRGPDGRIDQCNFLKIVDDVDSPNGAPPLDTNWLGGSTLAPTIPSRESAHPVAMQGMLPSLRQGQTGDTFDHSRNIHNHLGGYGTSESGNIDLDLSSDQNHSDRPTPNSSTASSLQPGQRQPGQTHSGRSSFDASPASSHQAQSDPSRAPNAFYNPASDFSNLPGTGMTPGSSMSMPDTPGGRDFTVPGGWEMNQGLTPVGEGLFQQLMGMGPMDMSWDGAT
jgi:hypothetical protein